MTKQYPEYTPRRINNYVPAMAYAADVSFGGGQCRVYFGSPAVADPDGIIDGATIGTSAVVLDSSDVNGVIGDTADSEYGRGVTVTGGTAGDNAVVIVKGRDYWGQPMAETFTLSGATPQQGSKAFKYVDTVEVAANQASTIDVGWNDELGLPYKALDIVSEIVDGALGTDGTLTGPDLTDPQTVSDGDPRGTYNPNVTLDGTKVVEAIIITNNAVNASGNGGLLGLAHYYA